VIRNCAVLVAAREDVLDAGVRVAGQEQPSSLYRGVAYISAPARSWQQAAAFEGAMDALVLIHTNSNLSSAAVVHVSGHNLAGEYEVVAARASGNEQSLTLRKRAVQRAD
jgi:hypothetical protein